MKRSYFISTQDIQYILDRYKYINVYIYIHDQQYAILNHICVFSHPRDLQWTRIFCDGMTHPTRCWWMMILSNGLIWSCDQRNTEYVNPNNVGIQLYDEGPGSKYNKDQWGTPTGSVIPCNHLSRNWGNQLVWESLFVLFWLIVASNPLGFLCC